MAVIEYETLVGPAGAIQYGFTARDGGVSVGEYGSLNLGPHVGDSPQAVEENRRRVQAEVSAPIVWMNQIHSDCYTWARDAREEGGVLFAGDCDAVIVECGQAAAVMVADCVPLLLLDATGARAAAVHVGRAGMDAEIAPKVARAMIERGTPALALRAVLGAHICGRCYEVPEAMAADVGARHPLARSTTSWGMPSLDIARALIDQLGVPVLAVGECTLESDRYFSHRRSSALGHQAGRFAGIVSVGNTPAQVPQSSARPAIG
ncbi:YfiH family protein [Arcanobacterium wilhelmae]|uniref:YfiH family protein n=1 Tax=Arcanobacterium wilhelmae TaxID=1803177 RepID=A0ABT9N975_9ACTO|nr:polyphenol oxidase family protein [Arcanobacterium wilhelmae]MDP9800245.1 YfiH family protein [Arcanobacterium wilhelmae]WFN89684.1 polyphenol oxidase family protein [Arcanobacterium wilhelmae]